MKNIDLPSDKLNLIENDVFRYRSEYAWEYGIISKVIRRNYDTQISPAQIKKIAKKLGVSVE